MRRSVSDGAAPPSRDGARTYAIKLCCARSVAAPVQTVADHLGGLGFEAAIICGARARDALTQRERGSSQPTIFVVCVQGRLQDAVLNPLRQALAGQAGPNEHFFVATLDADAPLAMVAEIRRYAEVLELEGSARDFEDAQGSPTAGYLTHTGRFRVARRRTIPPGELLASPVKPARVSASPKYSAVRGYLPPDPQRELTEVRNEVDETAVTRIHRQQGTVPGMRTLSVPQLPDPATLSAQESWGEDADEEDVEVTPTEAMLAGDATPPTRPKTQPGGLPPPRPVRPRNIPPVTSPEAPSLSVTLAAEVTPARSRRTRTWAMTGGLGIVVALGVAAVAGRSWWSSVGPGAVEPVPVTASHAIAAASALAQPVSSPAEQGQRFVEAVAATPDADLVEEDEAPKRRVDRRPPAAAPVDRHPDAELPNDAIDQEAASLEPPSSRLAGARAVAAAPGTSRNEASDDVELEPDDEGDAGVGPPTETADRPARDAALDPGSAVGPSPRGVSPDADEGDDADEAEDTDADHGKDVDANDADAREPSLQLALERKAIFESGRWYVSRPRNQSLGWAAARRYCGEAQWGGVDGWRLPSRHDLKAIGRDGSLREGVFWSHSVDRFDPNYVYVYETATRRLALGHKREGRARVVCVRDRIGVQEPTP